MIRRELPLTTNASPAEPVANFRRGFSFVLAPAAADPVLDLDNVVHGLICFLLFPYWESFVLSLPVMPHLLPAGGFGLDTDGPDEAQQFACDCRHGFSLLLASSHQLHVALVQAVLRFPRNLGDLCRKPFLAFAYRAPIAGRWR